MNTASASNMPDDSPSSLELVIESKSRQLIEDFKVRRVLPSVKRRMVGPFIFLDQMGPEILSAGKGLDVAPHPHIGLATVTYLFRGEMLHRDSLGTKQMIRPGEVNWMTAGRGIAHSERTPPEVRNSKRNSALFGIQTWVALPEKAEESEPTFFHYEARELPLIEAEGKTITLIAGSLFGLKSPVETYSEMFYADALLEAGTRLQIAAEHEERAVYIVEGAIEIVPNGGNFSAGQLLILKPGEKVIISALQKTHLMLLGGEPMDSKRYIWWNFVSSSKERIEQAKADWREQRFAPVPEETEIIPLPPESRPAPVNYP